MHTVEITEIYSHWNKIQNPFEVLDHEIFICLLKNLNESLWFSMRLFETPWSECRRGVHNWSELIWMVLLTWCAQLIRIDLNGNVDMMCTIDQNWPEWYCRHDVLNWLELIRIVLNDIVQTSLGECELVKKCAINEKLSIFVQFCWHLIKMSI